VDGTPPKRYPTVENATHLTTERVRESAFQKRSGWNRIFTFGVATFGNAVQFVLNYLNNHQPNISYVVAVEGGHSTMGVTLHLNKSFMFKYSEA